MRKIAIRIAAVMAVAVMATAAWSGGHKEAAKSGNRLLGTWKMLSAKYNGEEFNLPEGYTMLKHVTPSQFMWATYDKDGTITRVAGGGYTVKADVYEETPEYGLSKDFDIIKDKAQAFTWKIDGKKWYHKGKLSNGLSIDEVWERVERK